MNDNFLDSVIESTATSVVPKKAKTNCKRLDRLPTEDVWYKTTRKKNFFFHKEIGLKLVNGSTILSWGREYPVSISVETKALNSQGFIFDNVVLDQFTKSAANHYENLGDRVYYTGPIEPVIYLEIKDLFSLTLDNFVYGYIDRLSREQKGNFRFTVEVNSLGIVLVQTNKTIDKSTLIDMYYKDFLKVFGRTTLHAKTK